MVTATARSRLPWRWSVTMAVCFGLFPLDHAIANPPVLQILPHATHDQLQLNFPAEARGGDNRLTYWLTEKQNVAVSVQLSLARSDSQEVTLALLLDGLQHPHRIGQKAAAKISRRRLQRDRVDTFTLVVAGHTIPKGHHKLSILVWDETGREFPGIGFSVMKDATTSVEAKLLEATRRLPADGRQYSEVRLAENPEIIVRGSADTLRPDPTGRLPILIRRAGSGRGKDREVTFVALLDGKQIPLGSWGPAPNLRVRSQEIAELDVTFEKLPRTGAHVLVIYAIEGLTAWAETEPRSPNPAVTPPREIAWLSWKN